MSPLLVFTVILIFHSALATNEAGNKTTSTVDGLSKKALERLSSYRVSIKYWDTENVEVQKDILKQLAEEQEVKVPGCPRIRFPLVCDNDGVLLENVCYFKMRRREKAALLPILVFTMTPIEQARAMCDKEIKTKP